MARLNHRCNNNADHIFVPTTKMDSSGVPCGVLVCFATSTIKQGEEIFITYSGQIDTGKKDPREQIVVIHFINTPQQYAMSIPPIFTPITYSCLSHTN